MGNGAATARAQQAQVAAAQAAATASATGKIAAGAARTAALTAASVAAVKTKGAMHSALLRARLMLSNNADIVKVPLPHTEAAFAGFSARNVLKCVLKLHKMVLADMEESPQDRKVVTHYLRAGTDPATGEAVEVRVSNPRMEIEAVRDLVKPLVGGGEGGA